MWGRERRRGRRAMAIPMLTPRPSLNAFPAGGLILTQVISMHADGPTQVSRVSVARAMCLAFGQ
eukprot:1269228-Amphidinium_carterae.1